MAILRITQAIMEMHFSFANYGNGKRKKLVFVSRWILKISASLWEKTTKISLKELLKNVQQQMQFLVVAETNKKFIFELNADMSPKRIAQSSEDMNSLLVLYRPARPAFIFAH